MTKEQLKKTETAKKYAIAPKQTKNSASAKTIKSAPKKTAKKTPICSYNKSEMQEIFSRFSKAYPEPKGELEYTNAYTLLVAVVLSAQATDIGVNRATRGLFKIADTPEKMVALGEEKLGDYIRTIGLWRNKAKNTIALSQSLIENFHSQVPDTEKALVSLPGVGRKTANVILNVVFGQPTMAVDTHIFRISNRIGLAYGKTTDAVEKNLLKNIPAEYGVHAHHWLIFQGRYVCKARKPLCNSCIIADLCKFKEKTNSVPASLVEYRAAIGLLKQD